MTDELHILRERVIWLKNRLKETLPFEEYKRLSYEHSFAGPRLSDLETKVGQLRTAARAAAVNAWGAAFYYCCQQTLDGDTFKKLDNEVKELLKRNMQQLNKQASDKDDEKRKALNRINHKKAKLRQKREKFRDEYASGRYDQTWWKKGGWGHANPNVIVERKK
jgi:hypothetical protein